MGIISNLLPADDAGLEGSIGSWTAGSNTTVARVTTQALTGTASLRLTSSAAGAMSASTGKVPVTTGVTYMGFCFGANTTSTAGRVLSVRIDWYTAANALVSSTTTTSTWALGANTSWSNTVVVIGAAPATATQAALTVMVTAGITGSGQQVVFDSMGLGLPAGLTGNVLPYVVESVEMDASGWSATTNCTVARAAGAAEGSYCLGLTSTASGSTTATTAARWPVTAGVEYEIATRVVCPAAGRTLVFEARWYTAITGGTLLSTTTRTVTTQDPASWERWTTIATAPATATHVEMRLRPTATGASENWYFDQMVIRPTSAGLVAGNLLSFAAQSFEVDASNWTASSNCTVAQSVPADPVFDGGRSLKVTVTAAGQARVQAAALVPVTAGLYYVARQWHYGVAAHQAWTDIDWYAADGTTYLGRAFPDTDAAGTAGVWRSNFIGRQAPTGAAFARMVLLPQAATPGQIFFIDQVSLVQTAPPYILTVVPSTASVTIQIGSIPHPTTITLSRVDPDGTRHPVRAMGGDAAGLATTGTTMIFEDYEVPLNVGVHYEYSWPGSSTSTTSVTIPPPSQPYMLWLKDPGQPARNVCLMARSTGAWSRKVDRGVYPVRGARMPVIISDTRTSREGSVQVYTRSADEEAALDWLLDTGSTLLLQGLNLGSVYVSVGDSEDAPVDADGSDPWRVWTLPITELDRPIGGIQGTAGRTWQNIYNNYATWQAVFDAYETWLGVLTGVEGT
ncbi:hypothetical protein ACFRCG_39960 [Embleya sp. NPDC056575]|uniref:hypothetical protein n=1 Tax=unclassified Embleya TaxID=2699296 RepID=UPI003685AE04